MQIGNSLTDLCLEEICEKQANSRRRRRKVRGEEGMADVVENEPSSRNYQIPSAAGFSRSAVWRTVRDIHLYSFHVQPVQRLQPFLATGAT
jgi:hypothetical protein